MIGIDIGNAVSLVLVAMLSIGTAAHALLHVRDPRAAWGWIAACWLAPVVGPLLYLLFGTDRLEALARRALGARPASPLPALDHVIPEELRELVRIGDATTGRPLVAGNRLRMLHDGNEAYPEMLAAIAGARRSVQLSSYIFRGDEVGQAFARELAAARDRGVAVRVLIDGVGDLYYWPRGSRLLRRHAIPTQCFHVARRFLPVPHLNLRDHRKLLVVDGEVAFAGGINIGAHQLREARRPVRDVHFRIEGPVVAQLADVFERDWAAGGGPLMPPALAGTCSADQDGSDCRVITIGPDEEVDRLELVLLAALANAHQRVSIMTPYFIPTEALSRAFESAALRGVDVQLVLPRRSNLPWVDWASRRWLRALLAQGVRVFLSPAPFVHAKLLVVDGYYAQIGSANLDSRSLRLNFELVVETYGRSLGASIQSTIDLARDRSDELTLEELRGAGVCQNLRDAFFWMFSAYL
ncbi:MAG TPA: phospholipase D-like domain-containing protein [Nevskiaceae bacterium]|nr:phospholipase D-like domain-containing protein [Nevskiaceae bacterium]